MIQAAQRVYIHTGGAGGRPRIREVRVTDAVNIDQLVRGAGFDTPEALERARVALVGAGLTRAGKQAIAAEKVERVRATLSSALLRVCGDACLRIDRDGAGAAREPVVVTKASCEVCGGSNNRRAVIRMLRVLQRKGIERVIIVGGTPHLWQEMEGFLKAAPSIAVTYVDGTKTSHSEKDALANKRWSQLIVLWASTPLKHAVSNHYKADVPEGVRVVTVIPRSIEALCNEVVKSYT